MMRPEQRRTYDRTSSVVFLKTDGPFGGLSNMAGGFPLRVNGMRILTSEALYQACRFPHRPELQRLIIEQRSPMTAKMKSKPYRRASRQDWDQVRVKIMRWCLRVKLAQNWSAFSKLLLETGKRPIVEESRRDDFWGAKPTDDETLVGTNVLGRLLMELREAVKADSRELLARVEPIAITEFMLDGWPIGLITAMDTERDVPPVRAEAKPLRSDAEEQPVAQRVLFDEPNIREGSSPVYAEVNATGIGIPALKPYTEYRESGLPWLGQVPGHWPVQRTKWRFRHRKELNADSDHTNVLSLTLRGVVNNDPDDPEGLVPKDYRTYQFFAKGDLVFKLIDLENLRTSRVGLVHEDGIMSSAYVRLVPSGPTNMRYFFHQFYDLYSRGIYNQLGAGVRSTLGPTDLLNVGIVVPRPDEQAAIVRFLDWANGRLERAIRAKRKVIALLNEQKQVIIHRAVTRGLDPFAPLKSSRIPWLGDIPQHWEVRRLKSLCRFVTSGSRGWARYYADAGFVFLRIGNISTTSIDLRLKRIAYVTPPDGAEGERTRAIPDDLLLSITAQIGAVGIVPKDLGEAFVNQHTALIRLRQGESVPRWVAYGLLSSFGKDQCRLMTNGGTKVGLTLDNVRCLVVLLPPLEEQRTIVTGIERRTRDLDSAISRLEREIELLREYRTRLVADVVTGKLDVREAAMGLPDEPIALQPVVESDELAEPEEAEV